MSEHKLFGVGLDDVDQQVVPKNLVEKDNVICTYHRAYDTNESEKNRIDLCIKTFKLFCAAIQSTPYNQNKKPVKRTGFLSCIYSNAAKCKFLCEHQKI